MDKFKPSDNIMSKICSNEDELVTYYQMFPFGSHEQMDLTQRIYIASIFANIPEFYALATEKDRVDRHSIAHMVSEAFNNWFNHAPKGTPLTVGTFMADLGICYGFSDEGDFFKNPEIKEQIEGKISFEKFDSNPNIQDCFHYGFNHKIYKFSDIIEVDATKGIMYLVKLKENFIAPKGEFGPNYFYEKEKQALKK